MSLANNNLSRREFIAAGVAGVTLPPVMRPTESATSPTVTTPKPDDQGSYFTTLPSELVDSGHSYSEIADGLFARAEFFAGRFDTNDLFKAFSSGGTIDPGMKPDADPETVSIKGGGTLTKNSYIHPHYELSGSDRIFDDPYWQYGEAYTVTNNNGQELFNLTLKINETHEPSRPYTVSVSYREPKAKFEMHKPNKILVSAHKTVEGLDQIYDAQVPIQAFNVARDDTGSGSTGSDPRDELKELSTDPTSPPAVLTAEELLARHSKPADWSSNLDSLGKGLVRFAEHRPKIAQIFNSEYLATQSSHTHGLDSDEVNDDPVKLRDGRSLETTAIIEYDRDGLADPKLEFTLRDDTDRILSTFAVDFNYNVGQTPRAKDLTVLDFKTAGPGLNPMELSHSFRDNSNVFMTRSLYFS